MRTKGTVIPYEVFEGFREDMINVGINYFSNFKDSNNEHFIIPMSKTEVIGKLKKLNVGGGYMKEQEFDEKFTRYLKECEVDISVNIKYFIIAEKELY